MARRPRSAQDPPLRDERGRFISRARSGVSHRVGRGTPRPSASGGARRGGRHASPRLDSGAGIPWVGHGSPSPSGRRTARGGGRRASPPHDNHDERRLGKRVKSEGGAPHLKFKVNPHLKSKVNPHLKSGQSRRRGEVIIDLTASSDDESSEHNNRNAGVSPSNDEVSDKQYDKEYLKYVQQMIVEEDNRALKKQLELNRKKIGRLEQKLKDVQNQLKDVKDLQQKLNDVQQKRREQHKHDPKLGSFDAVNYL